MCIRDSVGLGIDTVFAQNIVERKLRRGAFAGGIDCLAFEVFNGLDARCV